MEYCLTQHRYQLLTEFVIYTIIVTTTTTWSAPVCQEPLDFEYRKLMLHYGNEHESFYLATANGGNLPTLAEIEAEYPQYVSISRQIEIREDFTCPDQADAVLIDPAQHNSTCPWNFALNTDPNRYPREIWEANCVCDRCLQFYENSRTMNQCNHVIYNIRVLRRTGCQDNVYTYIEALEPLRAGCMCTRAQTQESEGGQTSGPTMAP